MDKQSIVFEDEYIIIAKKSAGTLSEGENSIVTQAMEYTKSDYIGLINRLDRNVSGLIMLAKTKQSAREFSKLATENKIQKEYLAIVHNSPQESGGILKDILFKDSSKNKSFVVKTMRKGAKKASLEYCLLDTKDARKTEASLLKILLHTGRTHQIRVQFSSRKMPVLGDGKYGSCDNCPIALFSHKMSFTHPFTQKEISVSALPQSNVYPWNLWDLSSL